MDNFNSQQHNNQQVNLMKENNKGEAPGFILYLVLAIIQLLCCNQMTGVITLIYAIIAESDYSNGRIDECKSKLKVCKIATIIGMVLGILIYAFIFFVYGIAIIAEIASY